MKIGEGECVIVPNLYDKALFSAKTADIGFVQYIAILKLQKSPFQNLPFELQ